MMRCWLLSDIHSNFCRADQKQRGSRYWCIWRYAEQHKETALYSSWSNLWWEKQR